MQNSLFLKILQKLELKKKFIFFSIFYGISSLIVPFATQYLVNNLALSGILVNTLTFSLILGIALCCSQVMKFCQVILNEYLQREIYLNEIQSWKDAGLSKQAPYFFEIMGLMKSFSVSFSHLIEFALLLIFGLMVIVVFHPVFILLALFLAVIIWVLFRTWDSAVETSLAESNAKYDLFYLKAKGEPLSDSDIDHFLLRRDQHFYYIKKNKLIVGVTFVLAQIFLLGTGIYFIQAEQLSIGQLVSAEIILGGILVSLGRLPKTLEALYDFETSKIKIQRSLESSHE